MWILSKERSVILAIFSLIILLCIFWVVATWRNRLAIPKSLTIVITIICTILILASFLAIIFLVSYGYNSWRDCVDWGPIIEGYFKGRGF